MSMERTLALIKPNVTNRCAEIEDDILEKGFAIIQKRSLYLTEEAAGVFYEEHIGKVFFERLLKYMASGELIALILSKNNAISEWRRCLGPTLANQARSQAPESLRAKYGDRYQEHLNSLHGSDSEAAAQREISLIFPEFKF